MRLAVAQTIERLEIHGGGLNEVWGECHGDSLGT
jgi:hypothetical protein